MTLVLGFKKIELKRPKTHPTEVTAHWSELKGQDGSRLLQIDTRGSTERALPNKQSQTFQLTTATARELMAILKTTFDL
jgi:hypothetical protein